MKKALLISALFSVVQVAAQNPVQRADSLANPHRTDSVDFHSGPAINHDSASDVQHRITKDSLPMDDRKPKNPPKK